jgi:hypothetical protein
MHTSPDQLSDQFKLVSLSQVSLKLFPMDKLERLQKDIRAHVESIGLLCFPEAVTADPSALVVIWPGNDWKEFLSFAPRLGVKVIYLGTTIFEDLGDEDGGEIDLEAPSEHDGEIDAVVVTYVAGGILHTWSEAAPWRIEAMVREVNEFGDRDAKAEALRERAQQEEWAQNLAHDRRFYGTARVDRRAASTAILAELSGLSEDDPLLDKVRWSVIREADAHLPQVREALTDEGLSAKAALAAELVVAHPDWSTMRVALREKYARTLVKERFGMPLPIVAEEVARYKAASDAPTLL